MVQPNANKSGDANVATLLTWFLPGSGHLYVGRPVAAAVAFVLVESLFLVGLALSDGLTFRFLDPELRGTFATVLTPEAANLGGLVYQMKRYGFGDGTPLPWPSTIMLGSWLTALSGLVNVLAMIHVNALARGLRFRASAHPATVVGLTWLLPGLGHLAQGRRLRALVVAVLLVGLFAWGTLLAEGSNLSRERHFYYWSGQFLLGLPALVTEFASGRPPVTGEIELVDAGLLFACLAGLLNVLAMLDVQGWAESRGQVARVEPRPAARIGGAPVERAPVEGAPVDGGPIDGGPIDGGPIAGGPAT